MPKNKVSKFFLHLEHKHYKQTTVHLSKIDQKI